MVDKSEEDRPAEERAARLVLDALLAAGADVYDIRLDGSATIEFLLYGRPMQLSIENVWHEQRT